jgi:hypothetical protein
MQRLNIMGALIALLFVVFATQPSEAYRAKHQRASIPGNCSFTNEGRQVCGGAVEDRAAVVHATGNRIVRAADEGTVIGSRPGGCPRAYCGCGLRMYLGLADPRLNLASNWARLFPHESAARAGLAAVRSGHVMYIEAAAGDGQWLVRDYNSGGGLSRVHVRDVRGYAFVNPHAQVASANVASANNAISALGH